MIRAYTRSTGRPLGCEISGKEIADCGCNFRSVRFKCKVTGVEEADDGVRHVALERLCSRRQEERIVLAPRREKTRLMGTEILLKGRVQRDVALVVAKEVELHLVRARACEVEIVERVAVRRDRRRVGDTVRVLPNSRLGRQEGTQCIAISL